MISERFESLAQAFRVFTEQHLRFQQLFLVDAREAVGNVEHAIDAILNAFHSLHDATKVEAEGAFDFYGDPICAFVLRLRNARHHNQANGLRSIYQRAGSEEAPVEYLLVNFAAGDAEEGGSFAEHYLAWSDILIVLAEQSRKYGASVEAGRDAIGADTFERWCADHGYREQQVFINLVPILAAAGSACTPPLARYIRPQSTEAEAFLNFFQNVEPANFDRQNYVELTSALFRPT